MIHGWEVLFSQFSLKYMVAEQKPCVQLTAISVSKVALCYHFSCPSQYTSQSNLWSLVNTCASIRNTLSNVSPCPLGLYFCFWQVWYLYRVNRHSIIVHITFTLSWRISKFTLLLTSCHKSIMLMFDCAVKAKTSKNSSKIISVQPNLPAHWTDVF